MGNMPSVGSFWTDLSGQALDYAAMERQSQSQERQAAMQAQAQMYGQREQAGANKFSSYYGAQSNIAGYRHRSADNRVSEAERTRRHYASLKAQGNRDVIDATTSLRLAQGRNETDAYISRLGAEVNNYRTYQDNLTTRHRTASNTLLGSREMDLKAGTLKWLQTGKYAGDSFYNTDTTDSLRTQLADLTAAGGQPMTAGTSRKIQQTMDKAQRTAAAVDITNTPASQNQVFQSPQRPQSNNSGQRNQGTPPTNAQSDNASYDNPNDPFNAIPNKPSSQGVARGRRGQQYQSAPVRNDFGTPVSVN